MAKIVQYYVFSTVLFACWYESVVCDITGTTVYTGDCVCVTTSSGLHARDKAGLSGNVVTTIPTGGCGTIKGGILTTDGYKWFEISYNSQTVWVAGKYVNLGSGCGASPGGGSHSGGSCPHIISRAEWGARAPKFTSYLSGPVQYAFIHHADTPVCESVSACSTRVKSIQRYHMDTKGWSDIGYSFLIGGDGSVYEGRGWDRVGAHTQGYNSNGLGFCLIGDFTTSSPSTAQLSAVKAVIQCGVDTGKIKAGYTLRGHRDVGSTTCPGDVLYSQIQSWPHY